jgi:small subunit ribosomal protein S9
MHKTEKNNLKKFYGTGRRKTSSARVWISKGSGIFSINKKPINLFLSRDIMQEKIQLPFKVIKSVNQFDISATVKGGGISGQIGALVHGIVRAIVKYNDKYKPVLKKHKLTTRDSRVVERKKYGQAGARKKFQYSKR